MDEGAELRKRFLLFLGHLSEIGRGLDAAGRDHPHKEPCLRLMRRVAGGEIDAASDAEALWRIHGRVY